MLLGRSLFLSILVFLRHELAIFGRKLANEAYSLVRATNCMIEQAETIFSACEFGA